MPGTAHESRGCFSSCIIHDRYEWRAISGGIARPCTRRPIISNPRTSAFPTGSHCRPVRLLDTNVVLSFFLLHPFHFLSMSRDRAQTLKNRLRRCRRATRKRQISRREEENQLPLTRKEKLENERKRRRGMDKEGENSRVDEYTNIICEQSRG